MKLAWFFLLATLISTASWSARAQNAAVSEVALKSALFFKLPQFVYRPDDPRDRALSICLLGSNPFATAFERLALTPIDGRPLQYLRLGTIAEAVRCDFVFITQIEASQMDAVLRKLTSLPVVSVSDTAGFAKSGGMVELAMGEAGGPVSILINRKAARQQNIEFNAQLLRLARVVEP